MLQTPLRQFHLDHNATMVEFAGWEMPIRYGSIVEEHEHTRRSGGIFDVSHMGRVVFKGLHARRLLERTCSRRIGNMTPGQCRYTLVCNEQGGVRDDVIVYRTDDDEFLVVVNAANRPKMLEHFERVRAENNWKVGIEDRTEKTAMVALQGPKVMDLIAKVSKEIPALKRYRFAVKNLVVMKLTVSRTGYTGEDGVEVILPATGVGMALKFLLKDNKDEAGAEILRPAGLGARDSLRLEAGMPLYGHELGEEINALACGVDFAISLDKNKDEDGETFIGQEALLRTRDAGGPERRVVGLRCEGKRTPRQGMKIRAGDGSGEVGEVSSGCASPTLGYPIAMGFVAADQTAAGTKLTIVTDKGAEIPAEVVALPFYKAPK